MYLYRKKADPININAPPVYEIQGMVLVNGSIESHIKTEPMLWMISAAVIFQEAESLCNYFLLKEKLKIEFVVTGVSR